MESVLRIENLQTEFRLRKGAVNAVDGLSLELAAGECVGLVGESGCGKSTTGLSVMGLLPANGAIASGSIKLAGRELVGLEESELRQIRGNEIAMIPQDPLTSLNPTMRIGQQISEGSRIHGNLNSTEARQRALEVLEMVEVPRPLERLNQYPHELSGGLRQRVMIAMALVCEPKVLIADEPTTALDVTIQAQILDLIDRLRSELSMGVLLITHDMGVIAGRSDRVVVMYAGKVAEQASTEATFSSMRHPYTAALLASVPSTEAARERLVSIPGLPPDLSHEINGCRFAPRCVNASDQCRAVEPTLQQEPSDPRHRFACFHPVSGPLARPEGPKQAPKQASGEIILDVVNLKKEFPVYRGGLLRRRIASVKAVSEISFAVERGSVFGLVGESGCGKTTVARLLAQLERADAGSMHFEGQDLRSLKRGELKGVQRNLQLMFQDPFASLDPRMNAGASIREPLDVHQLGSKAERQARVAELLEEVGLSASVASRFPHEFSGGQRQRIGFARALATNPAMLIADEPVSALDVSIQAQLLNLMKDLQERRALTMLLVSHDLGVIRYMADRLAVMYLGTIVEMGPTAAVLSAPVHPYTQGLLDAVPVPDVTEARKRRGLKVIGELPSAMDPPSGCRFRTRCPLADERCSREVPQLRAFDQGVQAACHHPLASPLVAPAN
ncbi:MAG: ABC transporter ATP-binding protein [Actinomycetota bacterium]